MQGELLDEEPESERAQGVARPTSGVLPSQPHELVGRTAELAAVCGVLLEPACRLVTLLGVGGVGKTRLAVAAAATVAERFRDGVCFVDLTRVTDADAVPREVARALDLRLEGHAPLEFVQDFLRDRDLLLVLDNVEHVLPAAAMVGQVLETCPGVTVLTTSREPLRLSWEQRVVVVPLAIPDPDRLGPAEDLRRNPSVAIFIQRASAVDMSFSVTKESVRQIALICVRLEGIPLAIELAAARTNILSPADILERLEAQPEFLRQQVRDVPGRQESLGTTLSWSYGLLSAEEQTVFRRLGVFVGGFTLDAAGAVAHDKSELIETLDVLSSLVDGGLVMPVPSGGGQDRYRLLEIVRKYAVEQLQAADEGDQTAATHAAYYLALAEHDSDTLRYGGFLVFSPEPIPASPHIPPRLRVWPAALDADEANLTAALRWAKEHDVRVMLRLATALAPYWWVKGHLSGGEYWLELALARFPDADPALRAQALGGLGALYRQQRDLERAQDLLEEAVALARGLDEPALLVTQLLGLGGVLRSQGHNPQEMALTDEALERARAAGDTWGTAAALAFRGLGELLRGNPREATPHLVESLETFRRLGDRRSVLVVEIGMARACWVSGDVRGALPLIADSLHLCRDIGQEPLSAIVIELVACVLSRQGHPASCARLLGAGDGLRERGYARSEPEREIYEDALAAVRDALPGQILTGMMADGRQLGGEAAIAEALTLVDAEMATNGEAPRESEMLGPVLLSPREREVVALLGEGSSNKEIGEQLGISTNTVKLHVSSLLKKLGVQTRVEVARAASRKGLL